MRPSRARVHTRLQCGIYIFQDTGVLRPICPTAPSFLQVASVLAANATFLNDACQALANVFDTPPCMGTTSPDRSIFIRSLAAVRFSGDQQDAPTFISDGNVTSAAAPANGVGLVFDADVPARYLTGSNKSLDYAVNPLIYWTANECESALARLPATHLWQMALLPCLQRTFFTANHWFGELQL